MDKLIASIIVVVGIVVMISILGIFFAFPLMWCWNYVMPYLFGLKEITWGQAWCLSFVANYLIKTSVSSK